jgi:Flp pilus assembly protein TadD
VLAGAIVFVLGLLPILGLVPFDFQIYSTVADHYLYLPMLGIAIIIAFAVSRWSQVNGAHPTIGVVILVVVLGFCTFLQAMTWKDSLSLFNHALEVNPRSWMAHVNLASALNRSQRPQDAEAEARAALAIRSDIAVTYDNLAAALRLQGKTQEAIDAYRRATALDPKDSLAWTGLGHLLSNQGDLTGAIDVYLHAVDTNPYDPDARINLASALAEQGQLERAIELYQSALKLKPNSPEAMAGLKKAKEEISHRSGTDEHR